MDKVGNNAGNFRYKLLFLLAVFIIALAVSAALPNAQAGTVMAQPDPSVKLGPGESYPDSRFGQPPVQVDTGVSSGYAARAVIDMESSDESGDGDGPGHAPSRRPAGLEYAASKKDVPQSSHGPRAEDLAASAPQGDPVPGWIPTTRPPARECRK